MKIGQFNKIPWIKSLRFKLIFFISVSAIGPMVVTTYLVMVLTEQFIIRDAQNNLVLEAQAVETNINRWDDMNVRLLKNMSNLPEINSMDSTRHLPMFSTVNYLYRDYLSTVESYAVDGVLLTRGNGDFPDETDASDREWFKNALKRQTIYREAVITPKTNQLSIIFAYPIWSVNTLDLDNQGPLVIELQKTLKKLGFYQGDIDGIYGIHTGEAVLRFEEAYKGLMVDGITDQTTWQMILQSELLNRDDLSSDESESFPYRQEVVGVVKMSAFFQTFTEQVNSIKLGATGFAFLVNEEGDVLAHPNSQFAPKNEFTNLSYYPPVKSWLEGETGFSTFVDDWEVRWLSYTVKLNNEWGLILIQQEAEILEPNRLFRQLVIKIVGITLLVLSVLSAILASNQIKSISDLTVAASNLSVGSLTEQVNIKRDDEIGLLALAFNTMANQIRELINNLEEKVDERTAELAIANEELATANQKILTLNERLKAENIRLATEVEITRELQQMILPKTQELLKISGLQIAGFMEPAEEVGGDYYDVLQDADGNIKIGIGDVTGHGLESGVLMIMAQTAVRTLLESQETESKKFLDTLNRVLYKNVERMNSDKNMTLAILDYSEGFVKLSGQHEQVIVVRTNGAVELIDTLDLGFPIGLDSEIADFIDEIKISLNPEDIIVLYTDGITEAENLNNEQYGLSRLCEVVRSHRFESADRIKQAVIQDLKAYIGQQTIYDDITLLIIKKNSK